MTSEKTRDWLNRISADKQFQEDTRHQVWRDNIRRFAFGNIHGLSGIHGKDALDSDFVNVNFVYAYIKTIVPAVYFKDPYIFVQARGEDDLGKANTIEAIINYVWREINLKEEVKRVIIDTLFFGIGWLKIGYTAEFGRTLEDSTLVAQGTSNRKTPEGKVIEFNEFIKEENVFGKRISPFRVIVPRGFHRYVDMPYIIEEKLEDIEAVKDNKSLKNTQDLVPTHKLDTGFSSIKAPSMSNPEITGRNTIGGRASTLTGREKANKVILWEVWDKRSQTIRTFGKGVEKPLQERDWDLDIEGFPYVPLRFNILPDSDEHSNFYPPGDIEPMIPQLIEQSKLRTSMVKHRKKFMRKYLVEKGAMTQDQIDVLKEPETGLIAEVNDITKVIPTPDITVPRDLYNVNEVIKQDLREISGISQLLLGGTAPGINTATEANIQQQGATLRISEKQDQVEDMTRTVARKLIQVMRQFVDREFRLRTFIQGKEVDITGNREDLQAEVDVKIEAGSTQPPSDTAIERKQLIDFTTIIGQNPNVARFFNFRVLSQQVIKQFPSLKPMIAQILSGGVEDEQLIAQQENQLLQQGIIQLVHPNDDHDIHLQIHSIIAQDPKATTPEIAQHLQSHADFIQERKSMPSSKGSRADALTPTNITEQGSMRPADVFGLAGAGAGTGTSPPAGGR